MRSRQNNKHPDQDHDFAKNKAQQKIRDKDPLIYGIPIRQGKIATEIQDLSLAQKVEN